MEPTTRDVIVIGGGVSGLSVAYELEQHNVSYTLIEVKGRLGGSIVTEPRDGFVMDGGVFAFPPLANWHTLHDLNLADELIEVTPHINQERVAFKLGSQTLVNALAAQLKHPIIQRMAVTSIGTDVETGGYLVCLENGLALSARAVVVAVPARYAERMFRTLSPAVSDALLEYHYDDVTRVALGYTAATQPSHTPKSPPSVTFVNMDYTDHSARVPEGGLLIQAAVRVPLKHITREKLVQSLVETLGWQMPSASLVRQWTESDPLTVTGKAWREHDLNALLPSGVRLVGGCYEPLTLPERTEAGRAAARDVLATLKT